MQQDHERILTIFQSGFHGALRELPYVANIVCEGAVHTSVEGYLLSQPAQPGIIFLDHICEGDLSTPVSDLHVLIRIQHFRKVANFYDLSANRKSAKLYKIVHSVPIRP
jgi:hypothetical protein